MSNEMPKLTGVELSAFKARGKSRDLTKFRSLMKEYQGTNKAYPAQPILDYLEVSVHTLRSYCKDEGIKLMQRTDNEGQKFLAFT